MELRGERRRLGMYQGRSPEGLVLAQVAHVVGAGGSDEGWIVWLSRRPAELFGRYPSPDEAMAAAQAGLETS